MKYFQQFLEVLPDAVLVVDTNGIIQQANENVRCVLGFSPREIEGESVQTLFPEDEREHYVSFYEAYIESPESGLTETSLDRYALHKDGTDVPVEISLGLIGQEGELYVVMMVADLSERKQRERKLRRQNERLELFTSIVSHDFRSPLSIAAGRLTLAREEDNASEEHLDAVKQSLYRMMALIEALLTLSQAGTMVETVESVDLSALAEQAWQPIQTANATLVVEAEDTIPADKTRLQQLLENLLRNAVERGGENVTVSIGDLDSGFYVEADSSDIPIEEHDKLFKHEYTISPDGTAFGLTIVEEIAKAHGWQINVTEGTSGGPRVEVTRPSEI